MTPEIHPFLESEWIYLLECSESDVLKLLSSDPKETGKFHFLRLQI